MKSVEIAGRRIGPDAPPFVIAELSGNHNGELARALRLIDAAADAGAHAVKLQTYTADTITIDHDGPDFRINDGPWAGRTLHDLYQEAHTPWDWHQALFAHGRKAGVIVFSSPFDTTAVDLLENLGAPAYKIASFEVVDTPLIEYAAKKGKPLIISTGMASTDEIADALAAARSTGNDDITLLHCVSGYPTSPGEANLPRMAQLRETFGVNVGLSDHSLGTAVSVAATSLGATVIEKHITMLRSEGGPDAGFSMEPDEFKALCAECYDAWQATQPTGGDERTSETANFIYRRSLYAVSDIAAGEKLTKDNIKSIRPGHGLPPKHLADLLDRRAKVEIARGTPLSFDLIE